jgi:cytochrome c-type biogenesis protein CcmH
VIAFVILAGLLVAGALLFLLPPMLRGAGREAEEEQAAAALAVLREQLAELDAERAAGRIDADTYARSREELERRALEEGEAADAAAGAQRRGPARGWALGLALAVPVLAVSGYLAFGEPDALDPQQVAGQQGFSREQVAEMVGRLEARLQQEPDNAEGWAMLARTYTVLQEFPKAAVAYERLAGLTPNDADVFADWADVTAAVEGTVAGKADTLVAKALAIDPEHAKARAMAGTAAYQRGDYAAAAAHWEHILARLPAADEPLVQGVRASINEARGKAGLPPLPEASPAAAAPAGALRLSGRLEIAPALRAQLAPEDAVFVFARKPQGGPPLAALRFKGSELPLAFSFEQATMMGGGEVPPTVVVGARVSKSGTATAGKGDLEGSLANVAADASGVTLVIDRVRD